jgi:hypothetical protein
MGALQHWPVPHENNYQPLRVYRVVIVAYYVAVVEGYVVREVVIVANSVAVVAYKVAISVVVVVYKVAVVVYGVATQVVIVVYSIAVVVCNVVIEVVIVVHQAGNGVVRSNIRVVALKPEGFTDVYVESLERVIDRPYLRLMLQVRILNTHCVKTSG